MRKSNCKFCKKGIVLDPKCENVVSKYYCDIDAYDKETGCSNSTTRRKRGEGMKNEQKCNTSSKHETVANIVKRVRRDCNSYPLPTAAAEMLKLVREIDAAHQREVAELKSKMNDVVLENESLRDACGTCGAKREVAELRECLREAVTEVCNRLEKCGFK